MTHLLTNYYIIKHYRGRVEMKKLLLFFFTAMMFSSLTVAQDEVVIQFITINGYSNNLYIDNVSAGNQFNVDAAVTSINNIDSDTSYAIGSSSFNIAPEVTVTNMGKTDITAPFDVLMTADPGGYSSTKSVSSLGSGESTVVTFDELSIVPGTGININVTSQLSGDENPSNDVYSQYTMVLAGVQRANVLLEEWTNASCSPCATNNPTIDAFVEANFGTIVPVKYHVWWPGANDPMYLYNVPENTARTEYYGIGGVPHVIMGGVTHPVYPYTTTGSLQDAYDIQMAKGTPVEISVTDVQFAGDSIRADIVVTLHSELVYGTYYLRVMAIERWIHYASPPGTNGETDFYDVFRKAYPDVVGTPLPLTPGTYNYSFTYPIEAGVWQPDMIYSIAFVQDDMTKRVWGSDKGRELPMVINQSFASNVVEKPVSRPGKMNNSNILFNPTNELMGGFNAELFESFFPPPGWSIINPDGSITFEQFDGANGPTLGGTKSVKMDFYSYSNTGETDTMYSRIFLGLESTDSVQFDYAYAEYPGYGPDRMIVKVSIDGGLTFPNTIFDKAGAELATVSPTTSNFVPGPNDWETFTYSLDGIILPRNITVQSPNGGEVWIVGDIEEITWNSLNVDDVMIELSDDNGATWSTIVSSTPNTGSYSWTVAAQDSSDECLIRVTNAANSFVNDVSDDVFTIDIVSSVENGNVIPVEFELTQNYPNPFNPSTTILYAVPRSGPVSIKIYDLTGSEVATLVDEVKEPGTYKLEVDTQELASGIYLYRMIADDFISVKKMSVLK